MYADPRSAEFIEGVRSFLKVAEANKRNGFMCCPCSSYRNEKDYSCLSTLHFHLIHRVSCPDIIVGPSTEKEGL
jgi:hypothetical protein